MANFGRIFPKKIIEKDLLIKKKKFFFKDDTKIFANVQEEIREKFLWVCQVVKLLRDTAKEFKRA